MSSVLKLVSVLAVALMCGCHFHVNEERTSPKRDINAVLADNDKQLLAIPGVVGVYVGLMRNGKTLCIKVMLKEKTPEIERLIPHELEGYRVVTEVTGEIKPLKKQ